MKRFKLYAKRGLSWLLTIVMVITLLPQMNMTAHAAPAVWNGTVAAGYAGGDENCVCESFCGTDGNTDCSVCETQGYEACFYYYCICEEACDEESVNHECPICAEDFALCAAAVEPGEIAPMTVITYCTTLDSYQSTSFDHDGFKWDHTTRTVTLTNATFDVPSAGTPVINASEGKGAYTINLVGDNTINVTGNAGIGGFDGITFTGSGNLKVNSSNSYGIGARLGLTVSGFTGTLLITGSTHAAYSQNAILGSVTVKGSTAYNATAAQCTTALTATSFYVDYATYKTIAIGNFTPVITINTQPENKTFVEGSITGNLIVYPAVSDPPSGFTINYQWYSNTTASNTGGTAISGATGQSFTIPTTLTEGKYYYYCVVGGDKDAASVTTNVATVTVTIPSVALYFKEDPNNAGMYNLFAGTGSTVYTGNSGKWSVSGTTLTLKEGFSYATSNNYALVMSQTSTLKVEGDATLETRPTGTGSYGINLSNNNLTIDVAEGKTLTVTSENATNNGARYGIYMTGSGLTLTKKGKGIVNIISGDSTESSTGIFVGGSLVMDDGVLVAEAGAFGGTYTSRGIVTNSNLTVNGGEIYASGNTGAIRVSSGTITLAEGGAVRGWDEATQLYSVPAQFKVATPRDIETVSGNETVLSAKIFFPDYYISYDGNKGAGSTDPVGVPAKSARNATKIASAGASPTREGYSFGGWNTQSDGSGTNYAPGADYFAESDVTLYAKWTPNTYTVTLDKNGGTGGTTSVTATFDAKLPAIAVGNLPTRTGGYAFDGYYDAQTGGTMYYNSDGTAAGPWDKTEGGTLYAQWYFYTPPSGENYWDSWNELPTTAGSTLSGNYKVSRNATIQATAAGGSGLSVNGTTQIYIPKNITLTVYGASGSGTTGGGAAIRLPSGQTLTVRGEGTLRAYGGKSGVRANGSRGGDSSFTSTTATMAAGGAGGYGGGGAGAGIGGNGGTGGAGATAPAAATANKDQKGSGNNGNTGTVGSAGGTMGTLYVLGSVTVSAYAGTVDTSNGSGGSYGSYGNRFDNSYQRYAAGGAGGGGGGSGGAASAIGGGGAGGGGGGSGGTGGYVWTECTVGGGGGGGGGSAYAGYGGLGGAAGYHNDWYPGSTTAYSLYKPTNGGQGQNPTGGSNGSYGGATCSVYFNAYGGSGGTGGNAGTKGGDGTVYGVSSATVTGAQAVNSVPAYTLTYYHNVPSTGTLSPTYSGTVPAAQTIYGSSANNYLSANTLNRIGYTFKNWNTNQTNATAGLTTHTAKSGSTANGSPVFNSYTFSANTSLYASWSPNQYAVTLDRQGATVGSTSVTATYDSAMPSMTKPTRANYNFVGYFTGKNGTGEMYYNANCESAKICDILDNTTLYAYWSIQNFNVTLDMQGGTGGTVGVNANNGLKLPTITPPTKPGYVFGGYYTLVNGGTQYYNASGEGVNNWPSASGGTLYAKWTAVPNVPFVSVTRTVVSESPSNNGAISDTQTIILTYGKFQSAVTKDMVTVSNLPAGLGYTVNRDGDNSITITFISSAAMHAAAASVANATVTINKSAVEGASANLTTGLFTIRFIDSVAGVPVFSNAIGTTTPWVEALAQTSAQLYSTVTANGEAITERGFVYSTAASPTIGKGGVIKAAAGSGAGTFSANVTGLTTGVQYHFAAYAITNSGTYYSAYGTFTPASKAVLSITSVTPIAQTTATFNSNVIADGGMSVTERGFLYSSSAKEPELGAVGVTKVTSGSGTGAFTAAVSDLTADTEYYVRSYAVNSKGTTYGMTITIKTLKTGVSDSSYLKSLTAEGGSLVPIFDKDIHSYVVSVPGGTITMDKITAIAVDSAASVTKTLVGNIVYVTVTPPSGEARTYVINLIGQQSGVADLAGITVTPGTMSPAFDADQNEYITVVPAGTSSVTVALDKGATGKAITTKINGSSMNDGGVQTVTQAVTLIGTSTTVLVQTTSEDNKTTRTYTIVVIRGLSTNADLSGLTVEDSEERTLSPSFAASQAAYAVAVPFGTTSLTVTAVPEDTDATVHVSGNNADSRQLTTSGLSPFTVSNLTTGNNTLTIAVTAADGMTKRIYTITIEVNAEGVESETPATIPQEVSSNANLASFVANTSDDVTLKPDFTKDQNAYAAVVENNISGITFIAVPEDASASVKLGGSIVTGAQSLPLAYGLNTFVYEVVAADGVTTKIYTVQVVREVSSDAYLVNLTYPGMVSAFDKNTLTYFESVSNGTASVFITATPSDSSAAVYINGQKALSQVASLSEGENRIVIRVIARDGVTAREYTLNITRANANDGTLKSLTVTGATISPVFASGTKAYTAPVAYDVTQVSVTAASTDVAATVRINGEIAGTKDITLDVGANVITVEVTAQDGSKTAYTVTVTRQGSGGSTLQTLAVTDATVGGGGGSISLNPAFNKDVIYYNQTVPYTVNAVSVAATSNDTGATVAYYKNNNEIEGYAGGGIDLEVGTNTIAVYVISRDGTFSVYTITITRLESDSSALTTLTVTEGENSVTLTPTFDAATKSYTAAVANPVESIDIAATASTGATITGDIGNKNLIVGKNNFKVEVTAPNGINKTTYTLVVTRADVTPLSNDSSLLGLTVTDVTDSENPSPINIAFSTAVKSYIVNVADTVTKVAMTATPTDAGNATIKINGIDVVEAGYTLIPSVNKFTIEVTAENGTTTTYTVNVIRAQAAAEDVALTDLTVADAADTESTNLISDFTAGKLYYTAAVDYSAEKVTVTTTPTENVTISLNGGAITDDLNVGDNIITVTVGDGDTTTYTIVITRRAPDTTLSGLTVGGVPVGGFTGGTYYYTVNVPYGTASATITGTLSAQASADGAAAVVAGDGPLNVGSNPVTVTVSKDGYTTVYTVNIVRAEPDTTLSSLMVTDVTGGKNDNLGYTPGFAADKLYYTLNVGWATKNVDITAAKSADGTVTVTKVNDQAYAGGQNIPLTVGSNIITVEIAEGAFATTYTLTINRKSAGESLLSSLTVKDKNAKVVPLTAAGTGTFGLPSPNVVEASYTAEVPYETDEVSVTAISKDAAADAVITASVGQTQYSNGQNIPLVVGDTIITVTVSAPGVDDTTYTVTITRRVNTNADLSDLTLTSPGTLLTPGFDSGISAYTAAVSGDTVSSVTITATPAYDNTADKAAGGITDDVTVTYKVNGEVSGSTVNLAYGNNTVIVTVTAADGTTEKTYTLNIYRPYPTYDAAVQGITVAETNGGANVALSSTAFANEYSYTNTTTLESNVTGVTITLTLPANTTATINGRAYTAAMDVLVSKGQNVFTIVTYTPDGQSKTYSLTIVVKGALSGTAAISGNLKYGETLTAITTGILGNTGTLKYQWKADGLNIGTGTATYALASSDISKNITCMITSDTESGSVTALGGVITKADGPDEPDIVADDDNDVILRIDNTIEFSNDGGTTWVRYNGGNLPNLALTRSIDVRIAETATHLAGKVRTLNFVGVLGGTASIGGTLKFGETLSVNTGSITRNTGTLQYQWKRTGSVNIGTGLTYTTVAADVGAVITCVITSTVEIGSVTSAGVTIGKADGPVAPSLSANDAANTVSGTMDGTMEFSINNGTNWTTYSSNLPDLTGNVTLLVRVKETSTHKTGVQVTLIFTQDALRGTATISGNATVGSQLTVNTGSVTGNTGTLKYQWTRGGANISGATSVNYTTVTADIGTVITCVVTSTNEGGTVTASPGITVVKKAAPAAPTVSADDTANTITGSDSGKSLEYSINGGASWSNTAPDLSGNVTVLVRFPGTNDTEPGESTTLIFTQSILSKTASISGSTVVGSELTVIPANVTGTLSYQWKSGNVNVGGNTNTYTTVTADIGKVITCVVTGTNGSVVATGVTVVKADGPAAPDAGNISFSGDDELIISGGGDYEYTTDGGVTWHDYEPTNPPVPGDDDTILIRVPGDGDTEPGEIITINTAGGSISGSASINGTPKSGETLTLTTNITGNGGHGFTYQWYRDGAIISGAVQPSYVLTADDIDTIITCAISSNDPGTGGTVTTAGMTIGRASGPSAPGSGVSIDENGELDITGGGNYEYSTDGGVTWEQYDPANPPTFEDGDAILVREQGDDETEPGDATLLIYTVGSLSGTATLTGTPEYNGLLTANTGSISGNTGTLQYQWKRNGVAIVSATSNTYTAIQDDIGKVITCVITSDKESGSVTAIGVTIGKAAGPAAPGVSKGADNQSVNGMDTTMEFSSDGGSTWTKYIVPSNLPDLANNVTLIVRVAETDTREAGAETRLDFALGSLSGSASISGQPKFNQTLTAVTTSITGNTGTFKYQWKANGVNIGTNARTYVVGASDVGKVVTCVVTSTKETGSVVTAGVTIGKADGPAAPGVTADDSNDTITGVTDKMEYSTNGGSTWTIYNPLNPTKFSGDVTVQVRIAATDTTNAGVVTTLAFSAGGLGGIAYVDGDAQFGSTLTVDPSAVTGNSGTLKFQWTSDGINISGETSRSYTTRQADVGKVVTCVVTSSVETGSVAPTGITVTKLNGPAAPDVTGDDATDTVTGLYTTMEYSTDGGSNWVWYSGSNLPNLTGDVTLWVRVMETTTHSAGDMTVLNFSPTNTARLSGFITITPSTNIIYGATLTADTSRVAGAGLGTLAYQWKRDGVAEPGKTSATYVTNANDINAVISCVVTSSDIDGSLAAPGVTIEKANRSAPNVTADYDNDTLSGLNDQIQYTTNGRDWITYNPSNPPQISRPMTIIVRYAETETYKASATVTFTFSGITGTANIVGTAKFGQQLTVNTSNIIAENRSAFLYQWQRGGSDISGATSQTYTTVAADVGQEITCTVTSSAEGGTVISSGVTIGLASAPAAPNVSRGGSEGSFVITGITTDMEYSTDGGLTWTTYDAGNPPTLDTSGGRITVKVRLQETATHEASLVKTLYFPDSPGSLLYDPITQDMVDELFGDGNATLNNGTQPPTITLNDDVDLTDSIKIGTDVVIDLNGFDITAPDDQPAIVIVEDGIDITIENSDPTDEGHIYGGNGSNGDPDGDDGQPAILVEDGKTGGTITIDDGVSVQGGEGGDGTTGDGGNGGAGVSGGDSDVMINNGGSAEGGDGGGSDSGTGGNGVETDDGNITINNGGFAEGGGGGSSTSGTGGDGGNGAESDTGDIENNGSSQGGKGGNGGAGGGTGGSGLVTNGNSSGNGNSSNGGGGNKTGGSDSGSGSGAGGGSGGSGGSGETGGDVGSGIVVDVVEKEIASTETNDGTTTVTMDNGKLTDQIKDIEKGSTVVVSAEADSHTVNTTLTVMHIEDMAVKEITLSVQVGDCRYDIRTPAVNTDALLAALGADDSSQVPITITVTMNVDAATKVLVDQAIASGNCELVLPPMQFTITANYNGQSASVDAFSGYITRILEITESQADQITTALIIEADGTTRHVPTHVRQQGGKWYAEINSITNSTYALVYNEKSFADTKGKWYEDAVNEMGSRMVISGVGGDMFAGDRDITRAEFCAIIVKALGLPATGDGSIFSDISKSAWYNGAVGTAYEYGLVSGVGENRFAPDKKIARQEAMVIMLKAAKITGFAGNTGSISTFSDASKVSDWALEAAQWNVGSGLIAGSGSKLNAASNITRAETATITLKLVQKAGLVDIRTKF